MVSHTTAPEDEVRRPYTPESYSVAKTGHRLTVNSKLGPVTWHSWGKGRPLVLLHGGFGSWTHWIRNVAPLAHHRHVLAVDLPGHGLSPTTRPIVSIANMAEALHGSLATLVLDEDFDIAAFSFGSIVGGSLVSMLGLSFRGRFVMIGPPRFGAARSIRSTLKNWRSASSPGERLRLHRENLAALMLHDPACISEETVALQSLNVESTHARVRDLEGIDGLLASLETAGAQLGGIWGEHDALTVDHEVNRELLLRLDKDACYGCIPGAGHWAQYEKPDAFLEVLTAMLER